MTITVEYIICVFDGLLCNEICPPDHAAGHVSDEGCPGGEEAGVRAAVPERHPEPLAGAERDVAAELPGRPQQRQRQQVLPVQCSAGNTVRRSTVAAMVSVPCSPAARISRVKSCTEPSVSGNWKMIPPMSRPEKATVSTGQT